MLTTIVEVLIDSEHNVEVEEGHRAVVLVREGLDGFERGNLPRVPPRVRFQNTPPIAPSSTMEICHLCLEVLAAAEDDRLDRVCIVSASNDRGRCASCAGEVVVNFLRSILAKRRVGPSLVRVLLLELSLL